jgi:trehalose synthase
MPLTNVEVGTLPLDRFQSLLGERFEVVAEGMRRARKLFAGRVVWHLNSTARGGGVVELLQSLLAYARSAGVDNRWYVIDGNPDFFAITKRIHNNLHGAPGDGGDLGDAEREIYERTLTDSAAELADLVRAGDIVFLHDPQTAGLVDAVRRTGAIVVWRCHVGLDLPNELAKRAWRFLRPYVAHADAFVFSRREFAWEGLEMARVAIVPPSIDAFSPKNQDLDPGTVDSILAATGIAEPRRDGPPVFLRRDGSPGRIDRQADLVAGAPLPVDARLVTQVSRWDRLKDPEGVLSSFADGWEDSGAHLMLAGPSVEAVADDPEAAEVLGEVRRRREELPVPVRERAHLVSLPMEDVQENAAIVNAIQRRSDVVLQKSLAEGFGLTVAEAMWKSRPVAASACGGIQDQIVNGESGVLLSDPRDLGACADAVRGLLDDPGRAKAIGDAARERVREHFLGARHLIQYLDLLQGLMRQR